MTANRREFLKSLAASGVALGALPLPAFSRSSKPSKILILGGTNFVGPAIVNAALEGKNEVTLFNRGITNPGLYPNLRLIKGDRKNGSGAYGPLTKEKWDAVVDVWPEDAKLVDEATAALRYKTSHYSFISSIAVYKDFQEVGLNEKSAVVSPGADKAGWGYAEHKIEAERLVAERFPKNHTILRPGPIKGWRDSAEDLLYWLFRLKNDQAILAPGSGKDPLQYIDVKDVGRFAIRAFENDLHGVFNCTGPRAEPLLWDEFLPLARSHFRSSSRFHWASEEFLKKNKVRSFEDMPLWAPLSEDRGFMQISNEKSVAGGFEFTPLADTLDDIVRWHTKDGQDLEVSAGLTRERELELIGKLKGG